MKSKILKSIVVVLILLFVLSCSTVPLTGRQQLNLIPAGQIMSMSYQQYDDFLKQNQVSKDQENTAMIKRVGKNIQTAVETYFAQKNLSAELKGYEWEFLAEMTPKAKLNLNKAYENLQTYLSNYISNAKT